jgi:hypothetical protein
MILLENVDISQGGKFPALAIFFQPQALLDKLADAGERDSRHGLCLDQAPAVVG